MGLLICVIILGFTTSVLGDDPENHDEASPSPQVAPKEPANPRAGADPKPVDFPPAVKEKWKVLVGCTEVDCEKTYTDRLRIVFQSTPLYSDAQLQAAFWFRENLSQEKLR